MDMSAFAILILFCHFGHIKSDEKAGSIALYGYPLTRKGTATQLPRNISLPGRRDETAKGLVRSEIDPDVRCDTHRSCH